MSSGNIAKMAKGRFIAITGVASGALGVLSDIGQPLAPFSAWLMVISAISLLLLLITRLFMEWGERILTAVYLSAFTLVVSGGLFFWQQYLSSSDNGIIATQVPEVLELQKILGVTEKIQKNIYEVAQSTKSIDHKMNNVKKEVSENPKKELQNMGVPWKLKSFKEAITNGDVETLQLFIDAGFSTNLYAGSNNNFFLSLIHDTPEDKFDIIISMLSNAYYIKINQPIRIYMMGDFSESFVDNPYLKIGSRAHSYFMSSYQMRTKNVPSTEISKVSLPSYTMKVNLLTIAVWEGKASYVQKLLRLGELSDFRGEMDVSRVEELKVITPISEAEFLGYKGIRKILLES